MEDKSLDFEVKISGLKEEMEKVVRRMDQMQKSLDLLFEDRQILEEILGSIAHLKDVQLAVRNHQETLNKDLKADVLEVKDKVEQVTKDVQDAVDSTATDIVKGVTGAITKSEGIVNKILKK